MGFWIFMFVTDLLIPVCMIGFGGLFMKRAPGEINALFGYRTGRSMKNEDTWTFAHTYFGKRWWLLGWITLAITVVAMLPLIGKDTDTVGNAGLVVCFAQMVPMILPIFFTEKALKEAFDENGCQR